MQILNNTQIRSLSPSPPLGGEGWGEGGISLTQQTTTNHLNPDMINKPAPN
jgi:hypothetical protein